MNAFRLFLTESNSFETLREEVEAFCSSELVIPLVNDVARTNPAVLSRKHNARNWRLGYHDAERRMKGVVVGWDATLLVTTAAFLVMDAAFLLTDNFFIVAQYLEIPLERGWTRIRCKCVSYP
jgi:hypothetical protein